MPFDIATLLVLIVVVMTVVWLLDKFFLARRRGADAKEPLIVDLSRSLLPVFLIVLILRSFVFEPFRIPSGSMMPTLLVGDFILVNKYAYGLRWPVVNKKFLDIGDPQRGDVAVFRYPRNPSVDYIKRIVGVPGDVIEYHRKSLYINGEPQPQQLAGKYTGVGAGINETGTLRVEETLDGVLHDTLINPDRPDFAFGCTVMANGPVKVPEGHYLAIGDNRDNSNDGRCWGFVPEENLVGRASMIWMNFDTKLSGFPVDWGRIGNAIN